VDQHAYLSLQYGDQTASLITAIQFSTNFMRVYPTYNHTVQAKSRHIKEEANASAGTTLLIRISNHS